MRRNERNAALLLFPAVGLLVFAMAGCRLPGKPQDGPEVPRPEQVMGFNQLYGENCAGCHGANGQNGAATELANPEYQAWVDDATLRETIGKGRKGTLMPAFGQHGGGDLTDTQIEALIRGMRSNWSKPDPFNGAVPPAYRASAAADAGKGQAVYQQACASCHGADAQHPGKNGSILDGAYLALITPQTIRTTIVAGRPDVGQPDWRNQVPGHALSDAEVSDVSAWLIAQTPPHPGHPYPDSTQPNSTGQPASAQPDQKQSLTEKR